MIPVQAVMVIAIRRAVEGDLPQIGRVVVDAWRSTFAGRLPADFLDAMSCAHQTERHRRAFARPEARYHVASVGDGPVIGFASGGPSRHGDFPQENEVYAIFILEAYQRRKIGRALFGAVVDDLKGTDRKGLIVLALAKNPNLGFYEGLGGVQAMATPLTLGSETVDQFAYLWDDIPALSRNS
ncbi:MAG: GNAT family N-acetyltransferase [Sphingobium sp.]